MPREVKQQVLNGVTKLLPGDTKISYLVPNASFDGSTRAELESRLGNSPVEVMESAGLITVSPLGRLASFKSSVRPTMGA